MATERCACGHNREAHPLYRGICSCGITRLSNGQDAPNGNCMGWTPTIERFNPKDETSEEVPDGRRLGLEDRGAATTATPPEYPEGRWAPSFWFIDPPTNLDQAIQAATDALRDQDPTIGLAEPWAKVARIAVDAAAPILTADTQALRDKVADLEVHAAEQHDALVAIAAHHADEVAFPGSPLGKVRDALTVQPPQHRQQLQDRVERLERAARRFLNEAAGGNAPIGNWDGFNAAADELRAALDQGEAQTRQLFGYQTSDGRLYPPEDITLVYTVDQGEAQGGDHGG